ncbi:MAG TPA: hypothetical protein PKM40_08005 [Bacteroidia bacterium]|jgi:hypothetical protein|nr:hypothetical protein [Bacteroidia bacterium]
MKKLTCLFVCTTLRAQTLDFVLSADTIAVGDTLAANNISTYPSNTGIPLSLSLINLAQGVYQVKAVTETEEKSTKLIILK